MRVANFQRMFPSLTDSTHARAPMIAADHLAQLLDRPLDQVCKNGSLIAEGLLKAKELYHSDMLIVFADIYVEAEACGVELEYSSSTNPHPVSLPDLSTLKSTYLPSAGRIPKLLQAANICRASVGKRVPILFSMKDPFSLAAMVAGTESFFISLFEEPESAHKLLNVCCQSHLTLIDAICDEGFIPFIGAPISSGSLIGPDWFHRFAMPYLEIILDRIREHNCFCCMHICGEVKPLTDQLPKLGIDMLSFEEWYAPLWDTMQDTIPMGYVPTDLFVHGTEESIMDATSECLTKLPQPFILSTACDLPANADPNLVKYFMETV